MDCDHVRETISAQLDGEPGPVTAEAVDRHLAGCADCRAWLATVTELASGPRTWEESTPDATDRILRAASGMLRHRRRITAGLRGALLAVALLQLVLAGPLLILGHDQEAPAHVAHELGSLDLGLAVGFLAAVRRPARARGMLALVGAAASLLVLTAAADLVSGRTNLLEELPHALDVIGFVLLWLLTRSYPDPGAAADRVHDAPMAPPVVPVDHPRWARVVAAFRRAIRPALGRAVTLTTRTTVVACPRAVPGSGG